MVQTYWLVGWLVGWFKVTRTNLFFFKLPAATSKTVSFEFLSFTFVSKKNIPGYGSCLSNHLFNY